MTPCEFATYDLSDASPANIAADRQSLLSGYHIRTHSVLFHSSKCIVEGLEIRNARLGVRSHASRIRQTHVYALRERGPTLGVHLHARDAGFSCLGDDIRRNGGVKLHTSYQLGHIHAQSFQGFNKTHEQ
jgi:hypothetical protein